MWSARVRSCTTLSQRKSNMKKKSRFILFFFLVYLYSGIFVLDTNMVAKAEEYAEGKAECIIEASSGRVLYQSRGDLRLPMASTTKIATAATVLRLCDDLDVKMTIPANAVGIEGSSVYLQVGEEYSIEELLYGLMLRSGNDCATALALQFGGSIEGFSAKMNETAQMTGALHTRFSNPHGLPSAEHYTTAQDLCYITRFAMNDPTFQKIVKTKYYQPRGWKNKNKMLYNYDGAIGVKTGYTKEAGRCLVSAAERNDMTLICCVLNCQPMYERSARLMDDAFRTYKMQCLLEAGTALPIQCDGKESKGCVKDNVYYPLSDGEDSQLEIKTCAYAQVKNREIVGQFEIYLSKRLLFSGNLYKL